LKPTKTRRYFMAECECGWIADGYDRGKLSRAREAHQPKCPQSITRLTSSVTKVWNPRAAAKELAEDLRRLERSFVRRLGR
jgi:hypothetical protein